MYLTLKSYNSFDCPRFNLVPLLNEVLCLCKQPCGIYCKLSLASGSVTVWLVYMTWGCIYVFFSPLPLRTICQSFCVRISFISFLFNSFLPNACSYFCIPISLNGILRDTINIYFIKFYTDLRGKKSYRFTVYGRYQSV